MYKKIFCFLIIIIILLSILSYSLANSDLDVIYVWSNNVTSLNEVLNNKTVSATIVDLKLESESAILI